MSVGDDFHGSEQAAERKIPEALKMAARLARRETLPEDASEATDSFFADAAVMMREVYDENWRMAERLRIRSALLQEAIDSGHPMCACRALQPECWNCRVWKELAKDKESPQHDRQGTRGVV